MTWKNIIDKNLMEKYIEKAEKAKGVYVVYSGKYPYLPIDFGYSLYELHIRYNIPLNTLLTILHTRSVSRTYKISIRYVYIGGEEFTLDK